MRGITGLYGLLACLLLAGPGYTQDIPLEIKGDVVQVVKSLPFNVAAPEGYHLYHWSLPAGVTGLDKGSVLQVMAAPKGQLVIGVKLTKILWKDEKLEVKFGSVSFAVGDLPVPPGPTPVPPGPTPPVPPVPDGDAPIKLPGFRVMILYETQQLSTYPATQAIIPQSKTIRDYLDTKTAMEPDGKTRAYFIGDKDTDLSRYFPGWKEAMARPRTGLPWIIISNGRTGFEGPLPMTVQETLTLLKKYAE